jgi:hypothetical protein
MGNALKKAQQQQQQASSALLNDNLYTNASVLLDHGHLVPVNQLYPNTSSSSRRNRDYDAVTLRQLQLDKRMAPFYKGLSETSEVFSLAPILTQEPMSDEELSSVHTKHALKKTWKRKSKWTSRRSTAIHHARANSMDGDMLGNVRSITSVVNLPPTEEDTLNKVERTLTLADLYRDPIECPICFLYYPRNINYAKCCRQPICTECVLQIKRSDTSTTSANCPYCVQPDFGIFYVSPSDDACVDEKAPERPASPDASKYVLSDDLFPELLKRCRAHQLQLQQEEEEAASPTTNRFFRQRSLYAPGLIRHRNLTASHLGGNHGDGFAYLTAMRAMGMNLEDIMLAEAIRRSLAEGGTESTGTPTAPVEESST